MSVSPNEDPVTSFQQYAEQKLQEVYDKGVKAGREELKAPPVPSDPNHRKQSKIIPTCDCFVNKGMKWDNLLGLYQCSQCSAYEDYSQRSGHQQAVDELISLAGQDLPSRPMLPVHGVRYLRAKLIFEEAMETISALGFCLEVTIPEEKNRTLLLKDPQVHPNQLYEPNLLDILDGCADLSVVTIGTLSALGCPDRPILEAVDQNNLEKFKPKCPNCKEELHQLLNGGLADEPEPRLQILVDRSHIGWSCWACETQFPLEIGGFKRNDGKWVKGTNHKKVDLSQVVRRIHNTLRV